MNFVKVTNEVSWIQFGALLPDLSRVPVNPTMCYINNQSMEVKKDEYILNIYFKKYTTIQDFIRSVNYRYTK